VNQFSPAKDLAIASKRLSIETPASGRSGARLHMRETRSGNWIVQDASGRRGGCFFTYEAALKFIRSEFGPNAQIVTTQLAQRKAA